MPSGIDWYDKLPEHRRRELARLIPADYNAESCIDLDEPLTMPDKDIKRCQRVQADKRAF